MEAFIKTNETYLNNCLCVKESSNDAILKIQTTADNKPFICDICEKDISEKSHLNKHFRCYTNVKPSSCDICIKEFSQKHHLNELYRTHTNEKPYTCDVCHKQFSRKYNLNRHYRTHTNEKPYSCDVCNKEFSRKHHLNEHYRTHTNENPYSCDVCNKEFSQKLHLNKHYRTHAIEKPYPCDVCHKEFSQKNPSITKSWPANKNFRCLFFQSKQKKVQHLLQLTSEKISTATEIQLKKQGKRDSAAIIKETSQLHPQIEVQLLRRLGCLSFKSQRHYHQTKALVLMVDNGLSTRQYLRIREQAENLNCKLYPLYHKVKEAKQLCYPHSISVTETSAEITLQTLADHTASRICHIEFVTAKLRLSTNTAFEVMK
ncbi:Zinc finger protein 233 [Araneus ventricosus]|uniref:Zinc finger protein 233 n=1 Tax=Araneus ventricosus TaxID=182803 RepID=A0A4Y2K822_ARAVE|nr:Zinc finger protein 233 [Araneus ventricosus]